MKLLSVAIEGQYKGLKDQSFDFSQSEGSILALVGLNGSGKSQLLELICESFAFIERVKREDFKVKSGLSFNVVLKYRIKPYLDSTHINTVEVRINGKGVLASKLVDEEWEEMEDLKDLDLPQHIVGYSSGLNENLQRSFMKNSLQYYEVMRIRALYSKQRAGNLDVDGVLSLNRRYLKSNPGVFQKSNVSFDSQEIQADSIPLDSDAEEIYELRERDTILPVTVFLDYDSSSLLMACLAIFDQPLLDVIFPEIEFRYPSKIVVSYDLRRQLVTEDAARDISQLIRIVGDGCVSSSMPPVSEEEYEMYGLDHLAADITINAASERVRASLNEGYYGSPLTLFEKLYKIMLLGVKAWPTNVRKSLKNDNFLGNVKKPLKTKLPLSVTQLELANEAGGVIGFDDLSDGEAQLIQVVGAMAIYSHDNTLFIMDEPETHLNPSWRTYFHSHLEAAQQLRGASSRTQTLLSTHSPFMVSSLKRNDVYHAEKSESGGISVLPVSAQTYGTSFDILIKQHFGLRSLISQTVVDDVKQRLQELTANDSPESLAAARSWLERNLGESMEKAYLLRKLQG